MSKQSEQGGYSTALVALIGLKFRYLIASRSKVSFFADRQVVYYRSCLTLRSEIGKLELSKTSIISYAYKLW